MWSGRRTYFESGESEDELGFASGDDGDVCAGCCELGREGETKTFGAAADVAVLTPAP